MFENISIAFFIYFVLLSFIFLNLFLFFFLYYFRRLLLSLSLFQSNGHVQNLHYVHYLSTSYLCQWLNIDNETKVCDQTPHTPENALLNSLVNAETFYNNISIILGNEPLSTVRRNLIAGSALMLISIKRKEN